MPELKNTPLRVSIAGLGNVGLLHAQACLADPQITLQAVYDPLPERLAPFPQTLHSSSFSALLDRNRCDAIILATPPNGHAEQALAALEHGLDVLVEKPVTTRPDDAYALEAMVRSTGRVLQVGHLTRHDCEIEAVRQQVLQGRLGRPHSVLAQCSGIWKVATGGWRSSRTVSGGGVVMDLGIHAIDAVLYALGDPRWRSVYAVSDGQTIDSYAAAIVCLEGNSLFSIVITNEMPIESNPTSARLTLHWPGHLIRTRPLEAFGPLFATEMPRAIHGAPPTDQAELFRHQLSHFRAAIAGLHPPKPGIETARVSVEIVDAIYRSAAMGVPVACMSREAAP